MLRYLSCLLISISFFYCSGKNQDKILSDIITTLNSSDVYLRIYNQEMTYYEIKMDIGDVNVLSSYINGAKKQIAKIPAYYWIECKKDGQTVVSIGISEDCKGFKYNGASFIIDDDKSLELKNFFNQRTCLMNNNLT